MTGGGFDADLRPGGARFLLDRIEMTEKDNAASAALESAEARSAGVAEIGLRAGKGQVVPTELDAVLAQGTIGPEEHTDFLTALERFVDDRTGRIERIERINDLLARREKPDGNDPADRAAVDAVFDSLARAFAEHPPEDRASIENNYVARTGMLPATFRDRLLAGMLSEDPAAQVAAARRLVAFEDSNPGGHH